MPEEVAIEDYRFRSREKGEEFDHFSYPITNGVWLEKRHSSMITVHENTRSIVKKTRISPRSWRFFAPLARHKEQGSF